MASKAPEYTVRIGDLSTSSFFVTSFEGTETLSQGYRFFLQLASTEFSLEYSKIIGKPVSLSSTFNDQTIKFHGIVEECIQQPVEGEKEYAHYDIFIIPRLQLLDYSSNNRIFQNKNAKEIITDVLALHSVSNEFKLKTTPTTREFTVQYEESDLNFIRRLAESEGIFYYFDQGEDEEKLIFTDSIDKCQPILGNEKTTYHPETGLNRDLTEYISKLQRRQKLVTASVLVKDYNPETPTTDLKGESQDAGKDAGKGSGFEFAPNAKDAGEASNIAKRILEMHKSQKIQIMGHGNYRTFKAGHRIQIEDKTQSGFSDGYMLLSVTHQGVQGGMEGGAGQYKNTFTCVPAATLFRPAKTAHKPRIPGVLFAQVEGPDSDQYPSIDDAGRYKLRMPYDIGNNAKGQASLAVRLSQPHSGPGYGMHFPLHKGAEMVVGFVDGDPDRPIGLGTAPNPANGAPVKGSNNSHNLIKTATGHQLLMDDKDKLTLLEMKSAGNHKLAFNDDADHKEILLQTTDQHSMVFDDKNENVTLKTKDDGHIVKLDNKNKKLTIQTKYGHLIILDDEEKALSVQTKDGHMLQISDKDKLISLQDKDKKHVIQIDAGGGVVSIQTDGDMELNAKGSLNIKAKEVIMEAQTNIDIKATQALNLSGMDLGAKGTKSVALGGAQVDMSGDATLKIAAPQIEIAGKAMTKVSGALLNLEASGINTIKGALVMIN